MTETDADPPAAPLPPTESIVEAVLFASAHPVEPGRLAEILEVDLDEEGVSALVDAINDRYDEGGRPFEIRRVGGGFQFKTRAEYAPWIQTLLDDPRRRRLSPAVLESLAIIAYKQPILRADVEAIRGVDCGPIIKKLLDLNLIRIVRRDESLGRPILYGTSDRFLEEFGLQSIQDLPSIHELRLGSAISE